MFLFGKKSRGKKRSKNRNKSYKRNKIKVFKITPKVKRNKFKMKFKSIRHKKTRDFAELAFIKDLLKDLSKTLNKRDYKKLKRRVKKIQRKGSDKKWKALITEMKKQNKNNKLIPDKVEFKNVKINRGDSNKSILSKMLRFVLMTTLLMKSTNHTSSNSISALEAFSKQPTLSPSKAPKTELIMKTPVVNIKPISGLSVLHPNQTKPIPVKISVDINKQWRKNN